jgi:hypothetical protein
MREKKKPDIFFLQGNFLFKEKNQGEKKEREEKRKEGGKKEGDKSFLLQDVNVLVIFVLDLAQSDDLLSSEDVADDSIRELVGGAGQETDLSLLLLGGGDSALLAVEGEGEDLGLQSKGDGVLGGVAALALWGGRRVLEGAAGLGGRGRASAGRGALAGSGLLGGLTRGGGLCGVGIVNGNGNKGGRDWQGRRRHDGLGAGLGELRYRQSTGKDVVFPRKEQVSAIVSRVGGGGLVGIGHQQAGLVELEH